MTRSGPTSLYDEDFFAWTQDQAAALRANATALDHRVDIAHVAEEIEDLGKRDLREVTSFIGRLFEHLIKIEANPGAREQAHWRAEARLFRNSAADAFSPSMRRAINLDALWVRSLKRARADISDAGSNVSVKSTCPLSLDQILSEDFDTEAFLSEMDRRQP